ncbi:prepilin-type N-terminal cleavage/methylation domain-containing protein [bacterium]|nr:prepilin-type N-terminal cleavage/methylation domain-containing protein [bacterium]
MALFSHHQTQKKVYDGPNRENGFTLVEIVLVIILISILAGTAITYMKPSMDSYRFESTVKEMKTIKRAILGDPDIIINGIRNSFGYVGDMGGLPSTLEDLAVQGDQPSWQYDNTNMIGYGWNGPYIKADFTEDPSSYTYDGWGYDYIYSDTNKQLKSYGQDGEGSGSDYDEDITVDLDPYMASQVCGNINNGSGLAFDFDNVTIYYPDGSGSLTSQTVAGSGYYSFNNVPFGIRSLVITQGYGTWVYIVCVDKEKVWIPAITINE